MWVDDIEAQIKINNALTRETIDVLSGGIVDFDTPTTLKGFLIQQRDLVHAEGISRQDVGRLKAIPELAKQMINTDENTYTAERSFCGVQSIILIINTVINQITGTSNED